MYIEKKNHILSKAIFVTAAANLLIEAGISIYRLILKSGKTIEPDMLSSNIWNAQQLASTLMLFIIAVVFFLAWKKLSHIRNLIPEEDRTEMAKLQEETLGGKRPILSSYSVSQLLQLWAAILLCAQLIYQATSIIYKNFIEQLYSFADLTDDETTVMLAYIYNNSHGFKYIGMFIAITVGIFITGVFLRDKLLRTVSIVLILLYVAAISVTNMHTINIFGHQIGVVWTSVLFHFLQTIGLIVLSIYLAKEKKL